jgi:WD40 repeat protein
MDGTVRMWDLTLPNPSDSGIIRRAHGFKAQQASLSTDLHWLVSWNGPGGILQRSCLGGPADDKPLPITGRLDVMKISNDDHLLATISSGDPRENRTTLTLWDLETAAGIATKEGVSAVDLIDGGENFRLVSGGAADGKVKFWARGPAGLSPEPERVVDVYRKERLLPNYKDPRILAIAVTPGQKRLVVSDSDEGSHLCDLSAASSECRRLKDRFYLTFARLSPDGRWLLALARDGSARALDLQGKSPEFKNLLVRGAVTAVVFGQKNQLFLGTSDGAVSWYDLGRVSSFDRPMPPLALLMDRDSPISSLALSPDEGSLAVGSVHSTVRFWNVSKEPEWRPDHSITLFNSMHLPVGDHDEVILKVLFSKEGRGLVAVSETGVVRWWDLPVKALLEQAEATAGRNMSTKEWNEALPDVRCPKTFRDLPEGFQ